MAGKILGYLKDNGLQPKGNGDNGGQETPEEKEKREAAERQQQQQQPPANETPEEKTAREEKERLAATGDGGKPETEEEKLAREKKEKEQQQQQEPAAIDDAAVIAYLKGKGKKVESLDDIDRPAPEELTPQQKADAEQARKDNIRKFALTNKKVTSTEFDDYVRETSIPMKELAFSLYKEERLAAIKKANTPADQIPDDKALRDEFDETHFQYAKEDDPKRIRSEKLLQKTVDEHIENKYAKILDLEEEYEAHETTTAQRTTYGQAIEEVVSGLGEEMDFVIVEDKDKNITFPFKFKITPEVKKAIQTAYLSDASFGLFGKGNVNKDLLQQAIKGNIIQREFANILSEGALAYASTRLDEAAKGRRGIPPTRKEEGSESGDGKKVNKVVQGLLNNPANKKVLTT